MAGVWAMTDRTDLIAAARDLRDGLCVLGFPLIGRAALYEVGALLDLSLVDEDRRIARAEADALLVEGERLATRLQDRDALAWFLADCLRDGADFKCDDDWRAAATSLLDPMSALDGKDGGTRLQGEDADGECTYCEGREHYIEVHNGRSRIVACPVCLPAPALDGKEDDDG